MSLAPIAPWIIPPDYIGAAARGAQLGLSARSEDIQEESAADRLQLAYKQLASEEKRASEAAAARREQASAALALRAQQAKTTAQFQMANMKRQEDAAKALLDLHTKTAQQTADYHAKLLEQKAGAEKGFVEVKTEDPEKPGTFVMRKMTPEQYAEYLRARESPGTHPVPESSGFFGLFKTPAHLATNAPPTIDQFMATNRPPAAAALTPPPRPSMGLPAGLPPSTGTAAGVAQTYPDALPMRAAKEELVKGQRYQTARGVAVWDGEKFIKEP